MGRIKERSKTYSAQTAAARYLAWTALALLILCLMSGCRGTPTRKQINATVWLNNAPLPKELCDLKPELQKYGFYRKLDSGSLEFISFCNPLATKWLSIHESDFNKLLDEYLPEENP